MGWINKSKTHLDDVQESYWQHGYFAFKWGLFLIGTGIISILHGVFPFLFPFTAPKNILKMKKLMDERNEEDRMRKSRFSS